MTVPLPHHKHTALARSTATTLACAQVILNEYLQKHNRPKARFVEREAPDGGGWICKVSSAAPPTDLHLLLHFLHCVHGCRTAFAPGAGTVLVAAFYRLHLW